MIMFHQGKTLKRKIFKWTVATRKKGWKTKKHHIFLWTIHRKWPINRSFNSLELLFRSRTLTIQSFTQADVQDQRHKNSTSSFIPFTTNKWLMILDECLGSYSDLISFHKAQTDFYFLTGHTGHLTRWCDGISKITDNTHKHSGP